jgi:hypothetical protein
MNLMLETISPDGKLNEDLMPQVVRALTLGDMKLAGTKAKVPPKASALKRISERHRNLARVMASGVPVWEAAAMTGYSVQRISMFKVDPAFMNLIRFYSEQKDAMFETMYEKLAGMGSEAADLLRERMEEAPDEITTPALLDMVKVGADRTGHGPQSTNLNVNVNIADRLSAARKRIASAKQIDVKAEEIKDGSSESAAA